MVNAAGKGLRTLLCAGILGASGLAAMPVHALETVTLETPGAPRSLRDALAGASLVMQAQSNGNTEAQDVLAAARADYGRLIGVLYGQGYYGPVIRIFADGREVAGIPPLSPPARVDTVRIRVEPGPIFRFGETRIGPLPPGTERPAGFVPGAVAESDILRDTVSAAVDAWRADGHAKAASADESIRANHNTNTIDARFTIDPGPVVRFGPLRVSGNRAVREDAIRRIAGIPSGETFDPEEIRRAEFRLRNAGAFRSAAIVEDEALGPGDTLALTAELAEAPPRRFGAGAEYSTVEGLSLSGFWFHRNFRGGSERLRFDGAISGIGGGTGGIDYSVAGRYTIPAAITPNVDLFYLGEIDVQDEPNYRANNLTLGVGVERRLADKLGGKAFLGVLYSDVSDDFGDREFFLLTGAVTATYDSRDVPLDATEGYYLNAEVSPYIGIDDSESGVRTYLDGRAYYGFGEDNRVVLAGRLQFGSVAGSSLLGTVPDFLFYSGGGGTVRGQSYQSLGVDLGGGRTSGGRSFLGASAEIRTMVTESIGVVAFADTGFVGADSFPGDNGDWHSGAGLGLRYNTGIGPIRLDVATPIGGTSDGVEIYVGIGQAF